MTGSLSDLMQTINFNQEDLLANREGHLSVPQQQRISNMRRRILIIGIGLFIVMVFVATLLFYMGIRNDSTILTITGGLIVVINAVIVGMLGRQWMRLSNDLRLDEAVITHGKLERIIRPSNRINNYVVRVGEAEFSVKRDVFINFEHEQRYILYSTPYAHILLAAEPHVAGT